MATWNTAQPADLDPIKLGAAQIREDKRTLRDILSVEHDFPATGKHTALSIISGDITVHDGIGKVEEDVTEDADYHDVTLDPVQGDTDYGVFIETSWATACSVTHKAVGSFRVNFEARKGPGADQTLSWLLFRSGAT